MKIALTGSHALSDDALRARIDARVAHWNDRHPHLGIRQYYRWIDPDHAVAEYRGGRAHVALGPGTFSLEVDLPFFARLYRTRIEDFIRREIHAITTPEAASPSTPPAAAAT